MTAINVDLRELLEKTADTDFLREMIGFTAQRLMELEVETLTGTSHGSRNADRLSRRNGPRARVGPSRRNRRVALAARDTQIVTDSAGRRATDRQKLGLDGDPAALELERYAEELEAEIRRRADSRGN